MGGHFPMGRLYDLQAGAGLTEAGELEDNGFHRVLCRP